jgi:mannose-1-phosphate guanylyltransferase
MKAILLAAGLGTRLRPITNTIPKCLVQIKGKALLEIWLDQLSESGVEAFLINTHYLSDQVEYFISYSKFQNRISLVNEPELLGTAGTLIANLDFFEKKDGLLIHADNYCQADFKSFFEAHKNRPEKCLMTMMTFKTDTPTSCGIVEVDEEGVVIGFHEKVESPPGNLANGAIYILSADLLKLLDLEMQSVKDFSTEVLHKFLGRIYTWETADKFIDIGTPQNLASVN